MNKSSLQAFSRISVSILCLLGLTELALALWTIFDSRYRSLAYNLADVGYIDLWILRYLSLCLLASSIITIVMCLILIWGLCSAHIFLFIASTMIVFVLIGEFTISILTFASKYETRLTLIEQLPKLVITYRQGNDERARRALDFLQLTFRCCGSDGRLSFQNNVPPSCNMFSIGCLTRTLYFLDSCLDALAFVLLIFSLIKFFLILFFYSFICLYKKDQRKDSTDLKQQHKRYNYDDSSLWKHSSSFDSSSNENLTKKPLLLPKIIHQENDYQHETIQSSNDNQPVIYYEQQPTRKLSLILEKTENDENESDTIRHPKPRSIITKPIVKTRRRMIREEENDSGVEYSSSEKSFDENSKTKSPKDLSFSKVFITSVSHPSQTTDDHHQILPKSSISEHLIVSPRSILKKDKIYSKISQKK